METIPLLNEKRIVLGITGGIAAYKVCSVASHLTQAGAEVDVVMTEAARRFLGPLTLEALTGRPSYTSMWETAGGGLPTHIAHVGLGHAADLVVIAPTTANTLAKLAHGVADNLLTTLVLAARRPLLLAPAMDVGMWAHPATQANAQTLRRRGVHFAGPARGRMASGLEGEGRMVEPDEIIGAIRRVLGLHGPLEGRRVVVSAGPTREFLDPVRFLSNPSTGRQGAALAQAAIDRGAQVTLVRGLCQVSTPVGAEAEDVGTAREMRDAVLEASADADVLLMAAAVVDYGPVEMGTHKMKKSPDDLTLHLARTPDILEAVADRRAKTGRPRVVVGFAAETEAVAENAAEKLHKKNLDLIVGNDVSQPDSGFAVETNRVILMDKDGRVERLPLMSKSAVAERVLGRVVDLLAAA